MGKYTKYEDPTGEFAQAHKDFNLTCVTKNASGACNALTKYHVIMLTKYMLRNRRVGSEMRHVTIDNPNSDTVFSCAGRLFWGPMGSPYNKRYCLPTGSEEDTPWVQQVSWKGTIDTDHSGLAKQKAQLIKRTQKPPYPPMLKFNPDGALVLASETHVKRQDRRGVDPHLLGLKETFLEKSKVDCSIERHFRQPRHETLTLTPIRNGRCTRAI